ncbi:carbohydrate ABC transporter permease [Streptomyces sp. NPDC056161]|uniref:carbohydrate ABC transporter permease n=1 Tax=Streptomyces sp. NPDC056161 TaxID=3345732 RepID=UPI0035E2C2F8
MTDYTAVPVDGSRTGRPHGKGAAPRERAGLRTSRLYQRYRKYRVIVGFLAPPVALYAVFVVSPFLQAFFYSVTDWTGVSPETEFIGMRNYERLARDPVFWTALRHNLIVLLTLPVLVLGLSLFLTYLLDFAGGRGPGGAIAPVRGARFYRLVFFFPQVLSVAAIAVLWEYVFAPRGGLLNGVLGAVGPASWEQNWLGDPDLALMCVIAVMAWTNVGFFVIVLSSATASIPGDILAAAQLDGAGPARTFVKVVLPLLWDTVRTGWIYLGILALDGSFTVVNIMTVNQGGPDHSTLVLPVYLYNKAFRDAQAGYASGAGVALLIVTLLFAAVVLRLGRRERLEF